MRLTNFVPSDVHAQLMDSISYGRTGGGFAIKGKKRKRRKKGYRGVSYGRLLRLVIVKSSRTGDAKREQVAES